MVDAANIILKVCQTLNKPCHFNALLIPDLETPLHYCVQSIEQVYSSSVDLKGEPLPIPDVEWFWKQFYG